jgi:hypothetical protein
VVRRRYPLIVNESLSKPIVEPRFLSWFVHPSAVPPVPLGYIRDNRGGAFVIGGKTGSHYTGHGESWWAKLSEIAALGYIPVELASRQRLITTDWSPPALDDKDSHLVRRIQEGEI